MQLTIEDLKTLSSTTGDNSCSFVAGEKYLIRTVTFYYTGRIKCITATDLMLENAAWIADTGRFHNCLKNGTFNEVEPFIQSVIIPRSAIIDATIWTHDLPESQK